MHVVAINGGHNCEGITARVLRSALEVLQEQGVSYEFIQIGGTGLKGCKHCDMCRRNKEWRCAIRGDELNDIIMKMHKADGIVIASDVVFNNISPEIKAFIDRVIYCGRAKVRTGGGTPFENKLGMQVVVSDGTATINAFLSLLKLFNVSEMIVPMNTGWNAVLGRDDDAEITDAKGLARIEEAAKIFADNLKKLN